ncbi:MAG TPA: prolyl oligopeptidase family serine peptidase, partial [Polyangiales bacterium]
IDTEDPAYVMSLQDVRDPSTTTLRYSYESPTQPSATFELDVRTRKHALHKRQPVPTYDPSQYTAEYVHATAADGTEIPISLVYHRATKRSGTAPLLISAYGAYGLCQEPGFDVARVSLLDRGWVVALAHVRGGQELGRAWYDAGRLQQKWNTFTDFNTASTFLIEQKYAARDKVFAMGSSAGGLLMGAIANTRPDLYRGIVSFVPFLDVVTTMLDESIPLTSNEYEEWGNPTVDKAAYDYMLSYSPQDNIKPMAYPAMYIRTALWDSQVQYWEPAKYVAKLRATKTDANLVLLDTNMNAGHDGASGRFDALAEMARAYAFMLLTCA